MSGPLYQPREPCVPCVNQYLPHTHTHTHTYTLRLACTHITYTYSYMHGGYRKDRTGYSLGGGRRRSRRRRRRRRSLLNSNTSYQNRTAARYPLYFGWLLIKYIAMHYFSIAHRVYVECFVIAHRLSPFLSLRLRIVYSGDGKVSLTEI